MKYNGFIYLLIVAVAFLSGCIGSLEEGETNASGNGTITLNISNEPQTRAVLGNDKDNQIKTLGVWLTDNSGTILQFKESSPSAASTTVVFETVPRGEHKLYIVANYPDLADLKTTYTAGTNINAIESVELTTISDKTAPPFTEANGVTSSLIKDIVVAPGDNVVEAHLDRAVGRFTVTFRNATTDNSLFVGSIGLSKDNPSKGYLFGKADHSLPAGTEYLDFPDMTSVIRIGVGDQAVVYDTYLYESTPAISGDPFRMGFTSGLYDMDKELTSDMFVEGGTTTAYNVGNNQYSISNTSTWYMIRAGSGSTYYLYDNDGTLMLDQFTGDSEIPTNDDIKKYCWTFSAKSGDNVKIKNVATNREITMSHNGGNSYSVGLATNGDDFSIGTGSSYIRFSRNLNSQYRYIRYYGSSLDVGRNGDERNWALRPVTEVSIAIGKHFVGATASTTNAEVYDLKYIDIYGVTQNLEHICRNEHINLTVNVYHHVEKDQFTFEVAEWGTVSNVTTFD